MPATPLENSCPRRQPNTAQRGSIRKIAGVLMLPRLSSFRLALVFLALLLIAVTLGADRSTATAASNATSGSLEIVAKDENNN